MAVRGNSAIGYDVDATQFRYESRITCEKVGTMNFGMIIEVTATLIMAFLILSNADKFATAVGAAAQAYTGAITALQGR